MSFIIKKIDIKKYYCDLYDLDYIKEQLEDFECTQIFTDITSYRHWEKIGFNLKITEEIFSLKNNMEDKKFVSFLLNSNLLNNQQNNIDDNIDEDYKILIGGEENKNDFYKLNMLYDINELTGLLKVKFEYFLLLLYYEYYNILCDSDIVNFINASLTLNTQIILFRKEGIRYVYQESLDEIIDMIVNYITIKYFKKICKKEKINYDLVFGVNKEYLTVLMTFILYN